MQGISDVGTIRISAVTRGILALHARAYAPQHSAVPISRTAQMTAKYSTSVRTRGTDMKTSPFSWIILSGVF